MKVAVQGCCHGELEKTYEAVLKAEVKVDLLICCGDFQAVRDCADWKCMATNRNFNDKQTFYEYYSKEGHCHQQSFYKYYSGEKKAPVLTIFIGGNHEASNHLWELGYGGWVAPNIYYLGTAGVVRFGGLRIAGLSGIYKHYDYQKNHFEFPPYDDKTIRSSFHVRSCDVFRLKQLSGSFDIMLSHDWPASIYHSGNKELLLQKKQDIEPEELRENILGSPPAMELLKFHKPSFWFSGHLHVEFEAVYQHPQSHRPHAAKTTVASSSTDKRTEEIRTTKFFALDKPLSKGPFLKIVEIPQPPEAKPPYTFEYDLEWLAVIKATDNLMQYTGRDWIPPQRLKFTPTEKEMKDVKKRFLVDGNDRHLVIPENFTQTVPSFGGGRRTDHSAVASAKENPQTAEFCRKLGIDNPFRPGGKCTTWEKKEDKRLGLNGVDTSEQQSKVKSQNKGPPEEQP